MRKKVWPFAARQYEILVLIAIATGFIGLSGWLAIQNPTAMAYDGAYHFGLIQLYAHHLNPFLASQPAGADVFGAVARDPSYLYHYLMSFPLRLVAFLTPNQIVQILVLRGLNIGLGLGSLYLVWKLAKRAGLPVLARLGATAALAVTPVFYDVSSQINYDNLMLLMTLASVLLLWNVTELYRAGKPLLLPLAGLCSALLLASLVKYSFLPLLAAAVLYMAVIGFRYRRPGQLRRVFSDIRSARPLQTVLVLALLVLSSVAWTQRYGVNMALYHTPHPQCDAVLSVDDCSNYGPWSRNYQLHQTFNPQTASPMQPLGYTHFWASTMAFETLALAKVTPTDTSYTSSKYVHNAALLVVLGGLICLALTLRRVCLGSKIWWAFAALSAAYLISLWGQNYEDYRHLGAAVGVQGRYAMPVLPMLYLGLAAGYASVAVALKQLQLRDYVSRLRGWLVVGGLVVRQTRVAVEPIIKPYLTLRRGISAFVLAFS